MAVTYESFGYPTFQSIHLDEFLPILSLTDGIF